MYAIYSLINLAISLYRLCIIAYVALSWLRIPANQWTELLRRLVEPVLAPIRRLLVRRLPSQWQMLDWSPVVALLLLSILDSLVRMILFGFLR
ncbi:MAG: YggT family protein [Clostridia bacterium]|nr:YggT family protein [Clostridia bacterium]